MATKKKNPLIYGANQPVNEKIEGGQVRPYSTVSSPTETMQFKPKGVDITPSGGQKVSLSQSEYDQSLSNAPRTSQSPDVQNLLDQRLQINQEKTAQLQDIQLSQEIDREMRKEELRKAIQNERAQKIGFEAPFNMADVKEEAAKTEKLNQAQIQVDDFARSRGVNTFNPKRAYQLVANLWDMGKRIPTGGKSTTATKTEQNIDDTLGSIGEQIELIKLGKDPGEVKRLFIDAQSAIYRLESVYKRESQLNYKIWPEEGLRVQQAINRAKQDLDDKWLLLNSAMINFNSLQQQTQI